MDFVLQDRLKELLHDPTVAKLAVLIVGIVAILAFARFLRNLAQRKIADDANRYRASKLVNVVSFGLVVLVVALVFSSRLGGLATAFGLAGAGLAFALQEVITSVAGWIAISAGGFFKVGDRVQLGGIKGDVIDIAVLRTTVMELGVWVDGDLYNGRIVKVANSYVFKQPVVNYSQDFPFLWDEIVIPIRYGSDLAQADRILKDVADEIVGDYGRNAASAWRHVAHKYLVESADTTPMVTMSANDNWCAFTLRYTVDYRKRRATRDQLFRRIVEGIAATGGSVRLASATSEIVGVPRLEVQVDRSQP
jgi:small-conductance mechanosensitive channel